MMLNNLKQTTWYGLSASVTIRGPRSDPPIPTLTTSVIFFPENPFQAPLITFDVVFVSELKGIKQYLVAEVLHVVEHFVDGRHHVLPVNNHWHIAPVPQSNMENSAVLGEIDFFSCCV